MERVIETVEFEREGESFNLDVWNCTNYAFEEGGVKQVEVLKGYTTYIGLKAGDTVGKYKITKAHNVLDANSVPVFCSVFLEV